MQSPADSRLLNDRIAELEREKTALVKGCSDAHLQEIVEYQRKGLRKYVLVEKCEIDASPLSEGKLYLWFTFQVINYSIFYVTISTSVGTVITGSIRFKGEPVSGTAKLDENKVIDLTPYLRSYFKVRQWVNRDEAKNILETLKTSGNLFDFSEAIIHVKGGSKFPTVEEAQLDLTRGMQNADLENKVIQLENAQGIRALEFGEWKKYSDIAFRLNLIYGMALQAQYTIGFPGNTPLPKEMLDYLRGHIDSAIHQCLGPEARDNYFKNAPPVPDNAEGQQYWWIRSHCSMLEALIEQQHRQLGARKATTEHL